MGIRNMCVITPRHACTARVTVVGSVCLSVKSHLTSGASVRPENAVTYSAGKNICGFFSETASLQRSSTPYIETHTYIFPRKARMCMAPRVLHFSAFICMLITHE